MRPSCIRCATTGPYDTHHLAQVGHEHTIAAARQRLAAGQGEFDPRLQPAGSGERRPVAGRSWFSAESAAPRGLVALAAASVSTLLAGSPSLLGCPRRG